MGVEQGQRIERVRFASRDRDAVSHFINERYIGCRPRYRDNGQAWEFTATMSSIPGIGSDRIRSPVHIVAGLDPLNDLLAVHPLQGRLGLSSAREEVRVDRGGSALYPMGDPVRAESDDTDVVVLRLSASSTGQVAGELTGIDPADLRFESMVPVSAVMNRYWRSVVGFVHRELAAPDSAVTQPLVAEQLIRMATTSALSVFPNTTMSAAPTPGPGPVAPAALRRAVAYIEANAHRPITLSQIAEASRVGARALQQAFARHHDATPIGYLRQVRLERAHRELRAADPGDGTTVAAVAARWGFSKPERFSAAYRQRFQQLPSHTLRT